MTERTPRRFEFGGPKENPNRDHATIRDPRTGEVLHESYVYQQDEILLGDHIRLQAMQKKMLDIDPADLDVGETLDNVAEQFGIMFVIPMSREKLERIDSASLREMSEGLVESLGMAEAEQPPPNRQARRRNPKT